MKLCRFWWFKSFFEIQFVVVIVRVYSTHSYRWRHHKNGTLWDPWPLTLPIMHRVSRNVQSAYCRPMSIVAKRLHGMYQGGTGRGGGPWSRPHCVRWGPNFPASNGGRAPQFSAHLYCEKTAECVKMPLGMDIGLSTLCYRLPWDLAVCRVLTVCRVSALSGSNSCDYSWSEVSDGKVLEQARASKPASTELQGYMLHRLFYCFSLWSSSLSVPWHCWLGNSRASSL